MNDMRRTKVSPLELEIRRHFSFLLDKGFTFRNHQYAQEDPDHRTVELESSDCNIQFYNDRGELMVLFSPLTDRSFQIGLKPMIFFVSHGQNFIGPFSPTLFSWRKKQLNKLAPLLKEYIDEIAAFLGPEFFKYKSEIIAAGNGYMAACINSYTRRAKKV